VTIIVKSPQVQAVDHLLLTSRATA
jgi:hypothetical protein